MFTTDQAVAILKDHKDTLKRDFGLAELFLYGSYAKGCQRKDSDIDLLFSLSPNSRLPLMRLIRLEEYLKKLLDVPKVEVVNKKNVNPVVYDNLQQYAIPVF
jgi:predicted nucleotidyltransferase